MTVKIRTIEYRTVDKAAWGSGPWLEEPDKKQWQDEATGLPCLIVRGLVGALCGYVGVTKCHPWHGLDYDQCLIGEVCPDWCEHTPGHLLSVHGGITFANGCAEISEERWLDTRAREAKAREEAQRYPQGDSARWLAAWKPTLEDFQLWSQHMHETAICHLPAPDEPDDVWWFGFDCAHAGDIIPGMASDLKFVGQTTGWGAVYEYRDFAYVENQCTELAKQLWMQSK